MSSKKKLLEKLRRGNITAKELRTLMKQKGWELRNTVGSHEHWKKGSTLYTLATHTKDLKRYMVKQAQEVLLGEPKDDKKED